MRTFLSQLLKPYYQRYYQGLPQVGNGDVFLVSYPKSGNTWVRFVLAHLLTACEQQLHFRTLRETIPEWQKPRDRALFDKLPRPRFIKTHAKYTRYFPKIIYIIRDPRDVYLSYYHYFLPRLPADLSRLEFIRDKRWRQNADWAEHVAAWQRHPEILLIRYEDILREPLATFRQILDWTPEFEWLYELLPLALEMSSFDRLKTQENQHGIFYSNFSSGKVKPTFMRQGRAGSWQGELTEKELAVIYTRAGKWMAKFGYT